MTDTIFRSGDPATPPPLPLPPTLPGDAVIFAWSGATWRLAGLGLFNLCLTIVTLGIYHFWAKTEVRRRLASSIRINGEPLEYTGTGKELFLGFLIVLIGILLPFSLFVFAAQILMAKAAPLVVLPFYLLIWYLYGVAVYRARRYRRSRLRWRGVRGALVGSSWTFGWHYIWTTFVNSLTYYWMTPWRDNMLHRILIQDTRFGDRAFKYRGKAGPLYGSFSLAWVGTLGMLIVLAFLVWLVIAPIAKPLMDQAQMFEGPDGKMDWWLFINTYFGECALVAGLSAGFLLLAMVIYGVLWSLFHAREYRYFTSQTTLEGLRFDLNVSGFSMFWLFFSNTLMSLATLTILSPVAEARVARYFVNRLTSTGKINFDAIQQSTAKLSRTGEGLAEAFDVEANEYFILSI